MAYKITDKCVACGTCEENCPMGAIEKKEAGKYAIDPEMCTECRTCLDGCPADAIKLI